MLLANIYGCGQASSPVEKQEKQAGVEQGKEQAEKDAAQRRITGEMAQEQEMTAEEPPTYQDQAPVRSAQLEDGSYVQYGITLGTVEQRGKVQMLDAWILLPPEHHGDYDPEVVRAVADDVMITFEGGKIDTGYFDVISDVQMEGEPGKDYTLKDWAKKADGWGTLTAAFTEDGVFMSGPQAGQWEFLEQETGDFITG